MLNILDQHRKRIEQTILSFVPETDCAYKIIEEAMKYSLEAGGKRVRPVLTLEFCRILGGDVTEALPFAAGVEFIHTYSLIHDDLPCMDNDDMRRGKPSSHKKFGEAIALLAGDALLTHAFSCLTQSRLSPKQIGKAVAVLAGFAGANGMVGGQVMDLDGEGKQLSLEELFRMDKLKTAALIQASCVLGCLAADAESCVPEAEAYAENLGLAFQIIDDILDFLEGEGNSDIVCGKSTYVSLLGLEDARKKAGEFTAAALAALDKMDADTSVLRAFTLQLLERTN